MAVPLSPTLAALLQQYRAAAGYTQEELAERARLSVRTISDIERGLKHRPYAYTVQRLATALGLTGPDRDQFDTVARPAHDDPMRSNLAERRHGHGRAMVARDRSRNIHPVRHRGLPHLPPLIGRAREVAIVERYLDGEGPPVLVFAGAPGIGKTRLLQEAGALAAERGWCVLEGGCSRSGGQEPYTPLLQVLERDIRQQASSQLPTVLRGCAWLVTLLPELATEPIDPLPRWQLPPEQERRLMFRAVEQYLANVAGPSGTLLLLDDLQWAGQDALDLLLAALPMASRVPLRILGAYRDTDARAGDPVYTWLVDVQRAGQGQQHTLKPLLTQNAAQLVDQLLKGAPLADTATREQIVRRAGGVPFFLSSCALAVLANSDAKIPWDVTQSVRQRVATLPEAAQEVLRAAAVVGRVVARRVLAAMASKPRDQVLDALDIVCQVGLLEEEDHATYRFAHDIVREVVEGDLSAARRAALHQRAGEALEGLSEARTVEALAYHYARSEDQDKAIVYLEEAGDQAQRQMAHASAEGYYRELMDRLDQQQQVRDGARVREKLGLSLRRQGRYAAAEEVSEQAVAAYRDVGDDDSLARVMAALGCIYRDTGRHQEGLRRLRPLLQTCDTGGPSSGVAALFLAVGDLSYIVGYYAEAALAFERTADLARVLRDDLLLADAERWRGKALHLLGHGEEALRVLEDALGLAEAVGAPNLQPFLHHLASVHRDRGEFDASQRYTERGLALAELGNDPQVIALMTFDRGLDAFYTGAWKQARSDFERAVTIFRAFGIAVGAYPLLHLGLLCLVEGAWDDAGRYLDDSIRVRGEDLEAKRLSVAVLAERDLLAGEPGLARDRLVPLLDRPGLQEWTVTCLLPVLAWAYLDLGEVDEAASAATQAVARAQTQHIWIALVDALRVRALVATRQGDWRAAEHALEEGLVLAHPMPYPYAEARLLHVYGLLHARQGEHEPACERLTAALAIFRGLGASKDIEQVERDLASLHS
jgi:tetratricopeptide (TPR) repeat protein/transcriptional regulator with XRE-family HTH domain